MKQNKNKKKEYKKEKEKKKKKTFQFCQFFWRDQSFCSILLFAKSARKNKHENEYIH